MFENYYNDTWSRVEDTNHLYEWKNRRGDKVTVDETSTGYKARKQRKGGVLTLLKPSMKQEDQVLETESGAVGYAALTMMGEKPEDVLTSEEVRRLLE